MKPIPVLLAALLAAWSAALTADGAPYGVAIDRTGAVWFCRLSGDGAGRLDRSTGRIDLLDTGPGTRPRRTAAGADGMLWVTDYGSGKLAKIDPGGRRVVKECDMPAGRRGGPYAVTGDGAGRVWPTRSTRIRSPCSIPGRRASASLPCPPAAWTSARPSSTPGAATGRVPGLPQRPPGRDRMSTGRLQATPCILNHCSMRFQPSCAASWR